jgi:hypothetical protein
LQIVTGEDGNGMIERPLDVASYRGKRVLITARGICEAKFLFARALVGVNVARPGARGYGDRVRTERIDAPAWREYETVVDVAEDATGLDLVVAAFGASTIRIDDIRLTVLGAAGAGDERPRALESRALDNVVAFARLYGLVRYFHPSDTAAALDEASWERFVVRGVRAIEDAADAAALQTRLEELFAPLAPSVVIYPESKTPPAVTVVAGSSLHWVHQGIGISKDSVYRSVRGDHDARLSASITTSIDPALVRGKHITATLRAHGRLVGTRADAGLWIAERKAGGSRGFYTEPEAQPPVGTSWTEIRVEGDISADAAALVLGVQILDNADVWLETPVVTADGKPVAIAGWGRPGAQLAATWGGNHDDYTVAIGGSGCAKPRVCLHASPKATPPPDLRPWTGALGGGVAASVPLELATREGKTVPAARHPCPRQTRCHYGPAIARLASPL